MYSVQSVYSVLTNGQHVIARLTNVLLRLPGTVHNANSEAVVDLRLKVQGTP